MIGIYFSGTGNTKFIVQKLISLLDIKYPSYALEDECTLNALQTDKDIVLGYPVYFSETPKIVRDFINKNGNLFKDKNVFIVCTMGLFSGDGAGCTARLLKKHGAKIIGGLHIKMPDCIGDNRLLKKPFEQNKYIIEKAVEKTEKAAKNILNGKPPKDGLSFFCRIAGLFGQRLYFYNKTRKNCKSLKINYDACVTCGKCASVCPVKNFEILNGRIETKNKCIMCYRCFSQCPKKAITVLGKKIYEQYKLSDYVKDF